MTNTPNVENDLLPAVDEATLFAGKKLSHKPRILLLYGSLREISYSRKCTEEAARILERLGAETKTFNPSGLPLPDDEDASHTKVQELRELAEWSEGMVWC